MRLTTPATPAILDVDTGLDDAYALMFAACCPGIDLLGVTCAAGNVGVDQVVRNTLDVLDMSGAAEVPVASGATGPLADDHRSADHYHGKNGVGGVQLPRSPRKPVEEPATEFLYRVLSESSPPVTLIALAPLTNIALLLRAYPEAHKHIDRIVWMGGARRYGNVTASAEFNAWSDPEAAHEVLHSGIPITLYALEPFYTVTVSSQRVAEYTSAEDPRIRTIGEMLTYSQTRNAGETRIPDHTASCLGDAGAVMSVAAPELTTTSRLSVDIELDGSLTRGRTVMDERTSHTDTQPNDEPIHTQVITEVDYEAMEQLFINTVIAGVDTWAK
ncbi:Inosine-uridine preferring nucleoside hydrolase [Brevibacterium mcbrellneri ATCC 49030]|uniref:Inosine-uridine preferring nucleoside hydrolase n=1 Tax=Brevibacterium mcbrellneri ATCC 49030 TaxID=585530 RepID=D4YQ34_9MICO|nr:nucleoside hydrolase [Brevibacterium mcbrellneri]EFG46680.1 Inosine-uridine preferring nucleoside hydrolase [Brevibacterium mcbrellneri ATCC 49030]